MFGEWSCKWREGRRDRGFGVKMGLLGDEELKRTKGMAPWKNWVQIIGG